MSVSQSGAVAQAAARRQLFAIAVATVASPKSGSPGVSASAWQIFDAVTGEKIGDPRTITSRAANRHQWYALIMAARGVIEDCLSGDQVTVEISMVDLATAFQSEGLGMDGKYVKDGQTIAEVIKLAAEKGVTFSVKYAPVGPRQKDLKKKALAQANVQLTRLRGGK
nr:hypothetical protein [Mesorhizobium loti]